MFPTLITLLRHRSQSAEKKTVHVWAHCRASLCDRDAEQEHVPASFKASGAVYVCQVCALLWRGVLMQNPAV